MLCARFFEAHSVFPSFDGFVLAEEEGKQIAEALGPTNKAVILQNHGLLTVGASADGAAWNFGALERCLEAQLQTLTIAQVKGYKPVKVSDEQAQAVKSFYTDEFQYMTFQPA
jgi:ribulose-5-phosphate 4-epimerase/fuculose-1-phosphate aldolase